jgi:hypothetical protein
MGTELLPSEGRNEGRTCRSKESLFAILHTRLKKSFCLVGKKVTIPNVKVNSKTKGYCTVINPSLEETFAIKFCFGHKTVCGSNLKDSAPNNNPFLWCSGIMCDMKKQGITGSVLT